MSLNIKDENVHRMAVELAAMTGQSMTTVVREALREKLDRENAAKAARKEKMRRALTRIMKESSKALKGEKLPDHGEFLYDERGLPK